VRLLIDPGDIGAPPGSLRWCIAVHGEACASKQRGQAAVSNLQAWLRMLRRDNSFKLLADANDEPFRTWEDFVQYREPFGLGMQVEVVEAILAERNPERLLSDVINSVPVLRKHGRPSKDQEKDSDATFPPIGRGVDYLAARLKRDAPDIAARIDEFPSIRAAARAAGIIRDRTPLELLLATWRRASEAERAAFLTKVGAL
jgi:hypothetical protein